MANLQLLSTTFAKELSHQDSLTLDTVSSWAVLKQLPPARFHDILTQLEQHQIIQCSQERIHLHPRIPLVLGFDLGGTKVKGRLATLDGQCIAETEELTEKADEQAALKQMTRMAQQLLTQQQIPANRVLSVAIGIPGSIDQDNHVSLSPNLKLPNILPATFSLTEDCQCPVVFENDVNLAALGEYHYGHGKGSDSLIFIAFGTGVGMGIMVRGHLLKGFSGTAGEISLLPLSATPYEDAKTSINGIFEDRVSSHAIRHRYRDGSTDVKEIFKLAQQGDPNAESAIEQTVKASALGIACAVSLFNPEWLVLGGGIGARSQFYERVHHYVNALIPVSVKLAGSILLDNAGVYGAVHLAAQTGLNRIFSRNDGMESLS